MRALLIALVLTATVHGQATYDAALAARLKADDNGMKTYVMALLKAGPNRNRPREEAQKLQAAHRAGIYVFDVATVAEAEALTKTDPAIQAGQLVMELHPWYATAGLMTIPELHSRIEKK